MFWRLLVLSTLALVFIDCPTPLDAFVARSTGCLHNGTRYADKSMVPTTEKCLSCLCNKKTLVCRLKVCPEMPMPPPRGCVVVQKKNTCCPYLSCARLDAFYRIPTSSRIIAYLDHYERESIDRVVNENVLQRRSDDSEVDLYVCVKNGTVYKSGSAMSSSNLCTYCYCIGGTEKCVKPKCMLPVEGCKPIFVDSTCCPVRYDCNIKASGKSSQETRYRKTSNKHFLRMSQRLQRNRGCTIGKQFYVEGQKMKSDADKPCDICFCIRGTRRCAPKKCAPALKNCMPVVPKGQCCPSSYDCGSQRDYRRAQSSRQFNLFSLLFGEGEGEMINGTLIAEQYPHDRHPQKQVTTASKHKKPTAVTTTSEKSIFDTLREGLEFIDQNNQLLEDDLVVANYTITTQRPFIELSTTTEISFLDLLLGPSDPTGTESAEAAEEESEPEEKTTPSAFSWVDLLLGPDEEENKTDIENRDKFESTESTTTMPTVGIETTKIDRVGDDFDDFSGSGQIHVGEIWGEDQTTYEATTWYDETTKYAETTTELVATTQNELPEETTIKVTTAKPKAATIEITTHIPTTTIRLSTQKHVNTHTTTTKLPVKMQTVKAKPLDVKLKAAGAAQEQKLEKSTAISLQDSEVSNSKLTTTTKPANNGNGNGILNALIDGINGMLKSDRTANKTVSTAKPSSNTTPTKAINPILNALKQPTPQPLPVFKPLPTLKPYTRINSKIANLTLNPLPTSTKLTRNTTNIPLRFKTTFASTTAIPKTTTTSTTTTTTKPTRAPTTLVTFTTTSTSTSKPMYKTNPTILEAEPQDANNSPTLPPSLPNLKIIPFLPTDAVQADHNQLHYEYYHNIPQNVVPPAVSTLVPPLVIDGHWDSVAMPENKNSRIDYDIYDEGKIYPSITEQYQTYSDFEDGSKAEYIYKFKVEGPSSSASSNAGKVDGTASSTAFVKFDFGSNGQQINGFSPPTKTEGGFVPKEPLELKNTENGVETQELYQVTPHIIDITTSEPNKESTMKLIEITTPDPFKDVIKTEAPPDLFSLIGDKEKILEAQKHYQSTATTSSTEKIIHITTEIPEVTPVIVSTVNRTTSLDDVILKDKNTIASLLDLLFQDEELDVLKAVTSTTIPPFKQLPLKLAPQKSAVNGSIIRLSLKNNATHTTKLPHANTTITTTTERPTTMTVRYKSNTKTSSARPISSTSGPWPILQNVKQKPRPMKVKTSSTSTPFITSSTSKEVTTLAPQAKIPTRPVLSAPFDKLPFMDASFEVHPNSASALPHKTTDSFLGLVHYKNSLNKIEGLEPAFGSFATTTQTALETTTKSSPSTSSLTDPSGILKLAGCNIYGRMYRVGRIILELSGPCLECKCTEIGVKCGPLDC